jgi:hypothetical protein
VRAWPGAAAGRDGEAGLEDAGRLAAGALGPGRACANAVPMPSVATAAPPAIPGEITRTRLSKRPRRSAAVGPGPDMPALILPAGLLAW